MTIKVEVIRTPDAGALAAIHGESFERGWDAAAIGEMMAIQRTWAFVAQNHIGFGLLRHLSEDAEILTLAVLPGHRRHGVAGAIVNAMLEWAKEQGAGAVFLEVGERNKAARKLYGNNGFFVISRRKEYYQNSNGSRDHALVMRRKCLP